MLLEQVEELKGRVKEIESDMKPLYGLPSQMKELIEIQKETNQAIKDLSYNHTSKEVCNERHKLIDTFISEFKEFRKWFFTSSLMLLFLIIAELVRWLK